MAKKGVDIRGEMYDKVKTVHWVFIVLSLCVILRLVWVMLPNT